MQKRLRQLRKSNLLALTSEIGNAVPSGAAFFVSAPFNTCLDSRVFFKGLNYGV